MNYIELNMGLLGAHLVSRQLNCILLDSGEKWTDELLQKRFKVDLPHNNLLKLDNRITCNLEFLFCYLTHADIQIWAQSKDLNKTYTSKVIKVIQESPPKNIILFSTKSATSRQKGFPFLKLLKHLASEGYSVGWLTISHLAAGLHHDAHNTIIYASFESNSIAQTSKNLYAKTGYSFKENKTELDLHKQINLRKPRIGSSRKDLSSLPACGFILSTKSALNSISFKREKTPKLKNLSKILYPNCRGLKIYPVKLVSRRGIKKVTIKKINASYSLGPGVSAFPLFGVKLKNLEMTHREILLHSGTWHTKRDGWFVFRAPPHIAISLLGREASFWRKDIESATVSMGEKYSTISRGCPPRIFQTILNALS
jgi:hypothetical protein